MKKLLLLFLIFNCHGAFAQLSLTDDSLIGVTTFYNPTDFSYYQLPGNSPKLMKTGKKGIIVRDNPFYLVLKGSMWIYQNAISPQLSTSCPYVISCSNFAKKSIIAFGIIKGMAIAADRLTRCNRISLMDIHPIDLDPKTHHILDDPSRYKWHQ
ncbi:MAG TPA: membrane protein insertion efficiency factor YidD [Chitinophagaceae bacterium]|nr:membrane protein insertion efficiency factor YidD [Chitinophagaceae bacterium]